MTLKLTERFRRSLGTLIQLYNWFLFTGSKAATISTHMVTNRSMKKRNQIQVDCGESLRTRLRSTTKAACFTTSQDQCQMVGRSAECSAIIGSRGSMLQVTQLMLSSR